MLQHPNRHIAEIFNNTAFQDEEFEGWCMASADVFSTMFKGEVPSAS